MKQPVPMRSSAARRTSILVGSGIPSIVSARPMCSCPALLICTLPRIRGGEAALVACRPAPSTPRTAGSSSPGWVSTVRARLTSDIATTILTTRTSAIPGGAPEDTVDHPIGGPARLRYGPVAGWWAGRGTGVGR
jgi:hypothetical protein